MSNGDPLLVWISINHNTRIMVGQSGADHPGQVSDLRVGQKVEVQIEGAILESYPAQAAGALICILK